MNPFRPFTTYVLVAAGIPVDHGTRMGNDVSPDGIALKAVYLAAYQVDAVEQSLVNALGELVAATTKATTTIDNGGAYKNDVSSQAVTEFSARLNAFRVNLRAAIVTYKAIKQVMENAHRALAAMHEKRGEDVRESASAALLQYEGAATLFAGLTGVTVEEVDSELFAAEEAEVEATPWPNRNGTATR